jgi:hypothetical protein
LYAYAVRGAHSSAFLLGQGGGGGSGGGKGGSGGGREAIDWHTLVVVTGGLSMVVGEHVYGEPRRHPPPCGTSAACWQSRGGRRSSGGVARTINYKLRD